MKDRKSQLSNEIISYSVQQKIRMNFPIKKQDRLTFYRSEVKAVKQKMSPLNKGSNINDFRRSFVPDLIKNQQKKKFHHQMRHENFDFENKRKNYERGYEHLLSPKAKRMIQSPLATYRSAENFSPRTVRQNVYRKDNQAELEENRSVKFIARLREEISSNQKLNQCSRITKKRQKLRPLENKIIEKSITRFLTQLHKNQDLKFQTQSVNEYEDMRVQFNRDKSQLSPDSSAQKQTFQRQLIFKCRTLQLELQAKLNEMLKLTSALQSLQVRHTNDINSLKNYHLLQNSKNESEILALKIKIQTLHDQLKELEKNKTLKQKILQQQISKHLILLKQNQEEKSSIKLLFQNQLKQKLDKNEKSHSHQFNEFKNQIQNFQIQNNQMKKQMQHLRQIYRQALEEKQQIFEQSKYLSLELTNYTKWNDQLQRKNFFIERKLKESQSLTLKLKKEIEIHQQKLSQIEQNQAKSQKDKQVSTKLNQKLEVLRVENQSLRNQIDQKQKQKENLKKIYIQQIQNLEIQCILLNKEKNAIQQEADSLRKQIFTQRSLIASLQLNLEELKTQLGESYEVTKAHQKELKEKAQIITNLKMQLIQNESEIKAFQRKVTQLEQALRLTKLQQEKQRQKAKKLQAFSKQNLQKEDKINSQQVSQCLFRIKQLETELKQLILKFKKQKQDLIKKHESETKNLKQNVIDLKNQLLLKEKSYVAQKRALSGQIANYNEKILTFQRQIAKFNDLQTIYQNRIYEKQSELQQLTKQIESQNSQNLQFLSQQKQKLNEVQTLYEQKIRNERAMLIKSFQVIQKRVNEVMKSEQINFQEIEVRKKVFDNKNDFEMHLTQMTENIVSRISSLSKSLGISKEKIIELESKMNSQNSRVNNELKFKVSQLQKVIIEKQNALDKTQQAIDYLRKEKQQLKIQNKKSQEQKIKQQKMIQSLKYECQNTKLSLNQLQQKLQTQQRQHRKTLRQLHNQLEDYQNQIQLITMEKEAQNALLLEKIHNLCFSEKVESISQNSQDKSSNSLVEMVQNRLKDLRDQNQLLSSQFDIINSELLQQKKEIVQMKNQIAELRKSKTQLINENLSIKDSLLVKSVQQEQLIQKITSLQQQISKLNLTIIKKQEIIQGAHQKINRHIIEKTEYEQKINKLETQLQTASKSFEEIHHKYDSVQKLLQEKRKQIQNLQNVKTQQSKKHQESIQRLKDQIKTQDKMILQLQKQHSDIIFSLNNSHSQQVHKLAMQYQKQIKNQTQQIINKQKQINLLNQHISKLQSQNQSLQFEVEEWKFITQSNSLNKSLILETHQSQKTTANQKIPVQLSSNINLSKRIQKQYGQSQVHQNTKQPSSQRSIFQRNIQNKFLQKNVPKYSQNDALGSIASSLSFGESHINKTTPDSHHFQGNITFF